MIIKWKFLLFLSEKKRRNEIRIHLRIIERSSANKTTSLTLIANTLVFSSAWPSDYYAIINDAVRRQSHVSRKLTLEPHPWRGSYFIFVACVPFLSSNEQTRCQTRLQLTQPVVSLQLVPKRKKLDRTNGCNRRGCTIGTGPALLCSLLQPSHP